MVTLINVISAGQIKPVLILIGEVVLLCSLVIVNLNNLDATSLNCTNLQVLSGEEHGNFCHGHTNYG